MTQIVRKGDLLRRHKYGQDYHKFYFIVICDLDTLTNQVSFWYLNDNSRQEYRLDSIPNYYWLESEIVGNLIGDQAASSESSWTVSEF